MTAELVFKAPLANFEEVDDVETTIPKRSWQKLEDVILPADDGKRMIIGSDRKSVSDLNSEEDGIEIRSTAEPVSVVGLDNFGEPLVNGSLEDLVNTFDDKIIRCFHNYRESVDKLAPVHIRSQDDVMNECQMWWTITGNFGNILPIDWSKSYACKLHMPSLRLHHNQNEARSIGECKQQQETGNSGGNSDEYDNSVKNDIDDEEDAIAHDLDMHSLILSAFQADNQPPIKTADEVIREIDDMIVQDGGGGSSLDYSPISDSSDVGFVSGGAEISSADEISCSLQRKFVSKKLNGLDVRQLNEIYLELELLIKDYSETLIAELALRDELDFQKELKNSFISLLLAVQNRRRHFHLDNKNKQHTAIGISSEPKYLTTVIPYHADSLPLDDQTLQVLIKILKAINEDSCTVPHLLTDYILRVLCPT